jgi:hypothetical protein
MSVIETCFSFMIFLEHLFLIIRWLNCVYHSPVNFSKGSMDYCEWKVYSPVHIFVHHTEKSLCNVRISHLWMVLMMVKWGGRFLKLWCAYHLRNIILYCIYWQLSIICLLCIDSILMLTVASSSKLIHLAICRWLYSLHFLCS